MIIKIKPIYLVLFIFSILYVASTFPVFSTGDGGGLALASHLLGIAHPPGYPFYAQINKIFSFFPVGNIGSRIALSSVFFAVLSLYLVYLITKKIISKTSLEIDNIEIFSTIPVVFLGVAYSFYYNAVVIKFYPLTLFLVLLLVLIGLEVSFNKNLDKRLVLTASFLLGIGSSIHHTSLMMTIPLFILGAFYFKNFIRLIIPSAFLFFLGFLVNVYLYIRSQKDCFAVMGKAENLYNFYFLIARKAYGSSSSIDLASQSVSNLQGFINASKNLIYLLSINFSAVFFLFLILGFIYLFKKDRQVFIFLLITFLVYTLLVGKLTFTEDIFSDKISDVAQTLNVVGNQYFLPAMALFSIIFGIGIYNSFLFIKSQKMEFIYKVVPVILMIFPFVFLIGRFSQTNNINNWVPYYFGKDFLSISPVASITAVRGDPEIFGTLYLKLLGKYRDDVCILTNHTSDLARWLNEGCKPKQIYKNLLPEFFEGNLGKVMEKKLYTFNVIPDVTHPLYDFVKVKPYLYTFFWLLKEDNAPDEWFDKINLDKYKFISPEVCLFHNTDDDYTIRICNYIANGLIVAASSVKPFLLVNPVEVKFYGEGGGSISANVYINEETSEYIKVQSIIRKINDEKEIYLVPDKFRNKNER